MNFRELELDGKVRLRVELDEDYNIGDMFDAEVNNDIDPEQLKREENEFRLRIERT